MWLKVSLSVLLFFILGCGYRPSSDYQNRVLGDAISPSLKIDITAPQTSIFIKDALRVAIFTVFGKNIDKNATSQINVTSLNANLSSVDYDVNGFANLYRATVVLNCIFIDKFNKKHFLTVSGTYDFSVTNQSILDDQLKLNAYKVAAINALDILYAKITKIGAFYDNKGDS